MRDYNGDGRTNSHDSSIFHNVIMNDSGGSGGGSGGHGPNIDVSTIIILFIMLIFKPGGLFSGAFPTLVWLVCLAILFMKIFG